ncbi:T9SS type A sorting domain-containing protein [Polaribacter sargassicola]|uniref:T9SS type A sorting domain-containing protein n=1 Tax=Polaribacter sargassicola TaxID=2836891 RepID=UPI001F362AF5|nr:T9SS type A sorting domain-containing protein [Polaribacter sp. DS7-9]MCG1034892.1 T9SS type A sorting domain-containing protein [Polaribacter sp. DS7-9]
MTKIIKNLVVLIVFLTIKFVNGQTLSSERSVDWTIVGLQNKDVSDDFLKINMDDFDVVGDGVTPNDAFVKTALASVESTGAILEFSEGTFLFNNTISLPSNVVLKGVTTNNTIFKIDLSGNGNGIEVSGELLNISTNFLSEAIKGNNYIDVLDASNFSEGDWIKIFQEDTEFVTSDWANETVGQIVKIIDIVENRISLASPLRLNYSLDKSPYIKKINPVKNVGIENIKILRVDDTSPVLNSNILFNYVVNSWVKEVESENATYGHVNIVNGSNIYINQSYFHHAFGYGEGGRAYGVILQSTSNECLIEDNIFEYLRHSMLLQSGANGNVFAYNYSTDPYWDQSGLPSDSTGEITLHGNYPYANLFEQNICRNIVIDNSHGANGPFNTFLRNRADGYGIFFSDTTSPSQNFIGNDITNTSFPYSFVNYRLLGSDHFVYGNNNKGTITPEGTENLSDKSYVYTTKPDFVPEDQWAKIGTPNSPGAASIPARDRFFENVLGVEPIVLDNIKIFKKDNKTLSIINLSEEEVNVTIFNILGKQVLNISFNTNEKEKNIYLPELSKGVYLARIEVKGILLSKKFILE